MKTSDFLTACDQAISAAVNSVGAGILLVIFVGFCIRALGRTNAATRHALWFGTMVLLFAMVPAQWWRARSATGPRVLAMSPSGQTADRLASSRSRPEDRSAKSQAPADLEVQSEPWPGSTSEIDDATAVPAFSSAEELTTESSWSVSWPFSLMSWHLSLRPAVPQMASIVLALVWATVAGAKLSLLGWRIIGMRELKETSRPASAELRDLFVRLRAKLGVTRDAELRVSTAHRSALVLGFLRPVVLFPVDDAHKPEDAEPVLAHELAHIHRADDWANLAQRLVEAVLFFHPAVWWISKRLTLEREIASDDFVLQHGAHPQDYALLLVNFAGRKQGSQPMLASSVSAGKRQLEQRITMILTPHRNTSSRLARAKLGSIGLATVLAAILILYSGPKVVLAQNAPDAAGAGAAPAVEATPAESGPADVEGDPRIKQPRAAELPQASPTPPRQPRKPRPAPAPQAAAAPAPGSNLEERLDRLERMVESLVVQQKRSRGEHSSHEDAVLGDMPNARFPMPRPPAFAFNMPAEREAARAAELEKRALKQSEKAVKFKEKSGETGPMSEELQVQLQALERARETLQREMQKLERQIERIQREHEHTEREKQRRDRDEKDDRDLKDDGDEKGDAPHRK